MADARRNLGDLIEQSSPFLNITDTGCLERARATIADFVTNPGHLDVVIEAILTVAGSRAGASEILVKCIFESVAQVKTEESSDLPEDSSTLNKTCDSSKLPEASARLIEAIDVGVAAALPGTALAGFGEVWLKARGLKANASRRDELAEACASNDVAAVGRLVGARDVNAIEVEFESLPSAVIRRPFECALLDVAVGWGAVEVTKCLLEFHRATPTRETLKMAISSGNLELIRIVVARVPQLRERVDLLEVAADFHRVDVLAWLLRDASVFERELFMCLAIERRLADAVVVALDERVVPWWGRTP
jgi:hypothetical protein